MSTLTSTVTGHAGTIGRGGVVIAMSSGLVATMGLPAQAVTRSAPEAAPATAPIAVNPALVLSSGVLSSPAGAQASAAAPLTAPAAATVTFDSSTFKAVPNQQPSQLPDKQPAAGVRGDLVSQFGSARGASVLTIAARYVGVQYRYGGTTPSGWDCSGAMGYIYSQLGYHLPRTANAQMVASTRISRSEARAGDLVFFLEGGHAFHVGIFVGGNMMYDSGRTGKSFSKREIFSSNVAFGRVI